LNKIAKTRRAMREADGKEALGELAASAFGI